MRAPIAIESIERLAAHHQRAGFDCGEPALNDFLQRQAGRIERRGFGKTYVALVEDGIQVVGLRHPKRGTNPDAEVTTATQIAALSGSCFTHQSVGRRSGAAAQGHGPALAFVCVADGTGVFRACWGVRRGDRCKK